MYTKAKSIGIVGARGYVGAELMKLIAAHPALHLAFVSSRELDGQRVAEHNAAYEGDLHYEALDAPAVAAKRAEIVVLALPNGKAAPYVAAIDAARDRDGYDPILIDLGADYRFDKTWYYGLPELTREDYHGQRRISNPGCYATAMQLAIAPIKYLIAGPPVCFGVSGYSGAGTAPSDKNDPEKLRDNLIPYALVHHTHERETTRHLGIPVEFMPHVAPWFRGITLTANLWLTQQTRPETVKACYAKKYENEPLIEVIDEAPWVSQVANRHGAQIGGFTLAPDGKRLVVVATLDNLLKGAATQAMQNLNIALGWQELESIPLGDRDSEPESRDSGPGTRGS